MDSKTKGIKDFYDATANEWADKWYADDTMLPLLQRFMSLFHRKPTVLDVGCGTGYESMRLANLGAQVVGIDISEASIQIARARNPACRFEIMDCLNIELPDMVCDGIVAIALLVHIEDRALPLVFDNFKKVIQPKGLLFVAIVEGDGYSEKRSLVEIHGQTYNRAFYLHQVGGLHEIAAAAGFHFIDEWFLSENSSSWKYLVYQAV